VREPRKSDSFALALQDLAECASFWSAAEERSASAAFPLFCALYCQSYHFFHSTSQCRTHRPRGHMLLHINSPKRAATLPHQQATANTTIFAAQRDSPDYNAESASSQQSSAGNSKHGPFFQITLTSSLNSRVLIASITIEFMFWAISMSQMIGNVSGERKSTAPRSHSKNCRNARAFGVRLRSGAHLPLFPSRPCNKQNPPQILKSMVAQSLTDL
jgi:hypothetical protein